MLITWTKEYFRKLCHLISNPKKSTKRFDSGLHVFEQWVHCCENSSSEQTHYSTVKKKKEKERKSVWQGDRKTFPMNPTYDWKKHMSNEPTIITISIWWMINIMHIHIHNIKNLIKLLLDPQTFNMLQLIQIMNSIISFSTIRITDIHGGNLSNFPN